jgi:hypothetical protein
LLRVSGEWFRHSTFDFRHVYNNDRQTRVDFFSDQL